MDPTCPQCAETIASGAERCPHCGGDLRGPPTPAAPSGLPTALKVVIAVFALGFLGLCALGGAGYLFAMQARRSAMDAQLEAVAHARLRVIAQSLDLYRVQHGAYPEELSALWVEPADGDGRWHGPYLESSASVDPWGNQYAYERVGSGYTLTCYGEDGAPGGDGAALDLVHQR